MAEPGLRRAVAIRQVPSGARRFESCSVRSRRVAPGGGAPSSAATGLVELYGRREMLGGA